MSEVRVNNLTNENNTGGPTISGITTYSGRHFFVPPSGDTASRPEDCEPGSLRFNTDSAHLEYFRGDAIGWVEVDASSPELGGGTGSNTGTGARAIAGGGFLGIRTIEFVTISTTGDSQDFGDLTAAGAIHGKQAVSTETRMLFSGGYIINNIEFITVASTGNATDFGDMTMPRFGETGVNDTVRGIFAGGASTTPHVPSHTASSDVIDYVTIAQTGNAVDFGDLLLAAFPGGSMNNTTRGIIARQNGPVGPTAIMDTIITRTLGNATDFGDCVSATGSNVAGGVCNATRGILAGGYSSGFVNIIQFITMATTGDAKDFGDLLTAANNNRGASSKTRGLILGGTTPSNSNVIESVQIATTGNSVDFGDMAYIGGDVGQVTCNSNAHGGI
jgi:hypothetical protein